jgi:hypothetical protein
MAQLEFFLDGELINPPMNHAEAEVEFSFENDSPSASLSVNQFEFVRENVTKIKNWIDGGLDGTTPGLMEGMPLEIILNCEKEGNLKLFQGYLNLSAEQAGYYCDQYSIPFFETGGIDWLRDAADSFSFAYLYSIGVIQQSDFVKVFYVINHPIDAAEIAMLAVTTYLIVKETIEAISMLAQAIAAFISDGFDTASAALRGAALILIRAVYAAAIIIALISLLKQIINALFPVPRYYYGMRLRTLFERACQHLNLKFSSSILSGEYKNLVLLPAKFEPGKNITQSSKDTGFPEKTFGQLITDATDLFNAKVRVINGTLYLERRDFFQQSSGVIIPDTEKLQKLTNASQMPATIFLSFQADDSDPNTRTQQTGTLLQATSAPVNVNNRKNVTLKNLDQRQFPYARAIRKSHQSNLEVLFASIYDVFNKLVGLLGGNDTYPRIGSRIGYMMLNADLTGIDRLLMTPGNGLLSTDNDTLVTCKALWDRFHFINSPVPQAGNPQGNQYEIYKDQTVALCCSDILKLKNNNVAYCESLGQEVIIDSCKYNIHDGTAKISFRANKAFTKNLTQHLYYK